MSNLLQSAKFCGLRRIVRYVGRVGTWMAWVCKILA